MFSHELEYLCNKEYREWYDSLFNSLFETNGSNEKMKETLANQVIDTENYSDELTAIEIKIYNIKKDFE